MSLGIENTIFSEENLKGIFGDFDCTETNEEWKLKIRCMGDYCTIKIDKEKINNLLELNKSYTFEKFVMDKKKRKEDKTDISEHLVKVLFLHESFEFEPIKTKNLHISIEPISENFSLFFYLTYPLNSLTPYGDASVNLELKLNKEYKNKIVDFWKIIEILNEDILEIKSLRIESKKIISHSGMKRLANSYLFKCAYRYNAIVSKQYLFKAYHDLLPNERFRFKDDKISSLDINDEILILYQQAIELKDPFESYISFFHIIEYYFKLVEEEFIKDIIIPTQFYGLNMDFKNILKGYLRQEQRLELVLRKFVHKEWFKTELSFFDTDYYTYLENTAVEFANAKEINDSNFYESLTKRINKVRNALVHRKEGTNEGKYLPYNKDHRDQLRKELLLMKVVANRIIIGKEGMIEYY